MKAIFLTLTMLTGCGAGVTAAPAQGTSLVQGQSAPVDCHATCLAIKPQLVRDFGYPEAQVDCELPAYWAANDCASCGAVIRESFSVELTACP